MTKTKAAIVAMALVGITLTACVATAEEPNQVTEEVYRAAFQEYATCMEAAGYPLIVADQSATVVEYSFDAAAGSSQDQCYAPFQPIDEAWQVAHADTSEAAQAVRACLEEHGIESTGTADGDWELVVEHDLIDDCLPR